MIIQTIGERYYIIKYCCSDCNEERFIGQRENGNEQYFIVRIRNKAWIAHCVKFLTDQTKNRYFTDFVSCFMSEDCLHVVMKDAQGILLNEKLEQEVCSLEERMTIGRKILDKIMLSDMPDYFLRDCLSEKTVLLRHGLEIGFRYALNGLNTFETVQFGDVQMRLYLLFGFLFSNEIQGGASVFVQFCNSLSEKRYQEMIEIYTAYNKLCKIVQSAQQTQWAEPQMWGMRMWRKVKRHIPTVKKGIAVGLMILALLFLLYEIRQSLWEGQEKKIFEVIGTLHIEERQVEEQ